MIFKRLRIRKFSNEKNVILWKDEGALLFFYCLDSFVFDPKTLLNFFSFHAIFKIDEKTLDYLKKLYTSIPSSDLNYLILHKIKEEKHLIQRAKKIVIQFLDKDFW